jgi:hypothetical protein
VAADAPPDAGDTDAVAPERGPDVDDQGADTPRDAETDRASDFDDLHAFDPDVAPAETPPSDEDASDLLPGEPR